MVPNRVLSCQMVRDTWQPLLTGVNRSDDICSPWMALESFTLKRLLLQKSATLVLDIPCIEERWAAETSEQQPSRRSFYFLYHLCHDLMLLQIFSSRTTHPRSVRHHLWRASQSSAGADEKPAWTTLRLTRDDYHFFHKNPPPLQYYFELRLIWLIMVCTCRILHCIRPSRLCTCQDNPNQPLERLGSKVKYTNPTESVEPVLTPQINWKHRLIDELTKSRHLTEKISDSPSLCLAQLNPTESKSLKLDGPKSWRH